MPIPDDGVSFDISLDLEKSYAKVALGMAYECCDCSADVQLQVQPNKSVICTKGARAKQIRLVPLSSNLFQVDLNKCGYSLQPMVPGGHSLPLTRTQDDLTRTQDDLTRLMRRSITSFSLVTTYSHREQVRVPPTA